MLLLPGRIIISKKKSNVQMPKRPYLISLIFSVIMITSPSHDGEK